MKQILSTLVSLAVVFYAGRFILDMTLARDLMSHLNQCHEDLHVKDRINAPMSESAIDTLYDEWGQCANQKSNFIDRTFGNKLVADAMQGMREDRKKSGPYNHSAGSRASSATP